MSLYMAFAGDDFYPYGGVRDCVAVSLSKEHVYRELANTKCDWWHIAIIKEGKLVIIDDGECKAKPPTTGTGQGLLGQAVTA